MANATVAFDGWNSVVKWGEQAWGNGVSFISATGSVNSVGIEIAVLVSGLVGTGSVNSVEIQFDGSISVTGLVGTGSVNSVAIAIGKGVTGVSAIGSVNAVLIWTKSQNVYNPVWANDGSTQSPVWTKIAA